MESKDSKDFNALREAVQSALVTVTRSVNALANEDIQFQRTAHPTVAAKLDKNTDCLLRLANGVIKSAAKLTGQRTTTLEDVDDIEIQWKGVVDVIDSLLEKADTCLDEYTGLIKRKDAPTTEAGRDVKRSKSNYERLDWSLKRANILKPQNAFEKKVDNFPTGPWKPLLTTKPHAQLPLESSLTTFTTEEGLTQYKHPYEYEITNLKYPPEVFQCREPIKYQPIETTTAIWVDTWEGVLEMLEELKKATEIAIDLEHHDFRSYNGLLSLMQISTREKDWIVDTLVPWRHKLEILNEVFADPKIVKVLHGAFMDIIWLQRDLGLYIVGLFDTYYASDVLGYPGKSLAYLLKRFADFDADKKYQLADWRIRPLPEEMFYYARSDTHFLLYIYDHLRNELAELSAANHPDGKPIDRVIKRSKEESLQRYEHLTCDPETGIGARGWFNTLCKSPAAYNREQFAVYKAVHKWRDDLARREDESPQYFMTQQILADIARILPSDKKALWSLLNHNAGVLKPYLDELFDLIQEARNKGCTGPTMLEFFKQFTTGPAILGKKLPSLRNPPSETPLPNAQELKSTRSQLWGDVQLSSVWDPATKKPNMEGVVVIPLFYVDFSAEQAQPEPAKSQKREKKAESDEEEDEGFTLKKGTGRKRKVSDAGLEQQQQQEDSAAASTFASVPASASDSDAEAGESEDEEEEDGEIAEQNASQQQLLDEKALRKVARKAHKEAKRLAAEAAATDTPEARAAAEAALKEAKRARRAAKKAARQAKQAQGQGPVQQSNKKAKKEEEEEEETPFDYTKAASVLYANKPPGEEDAPAQNGGKGGKKFDPYTQRQLGGEELRPEKNLNYAKKGRTATFKK